MSNQRKNHNGNTVNMLHASRLARLALMVWIITSPANAAAVTIREEYTAQEVLALAGAECPSIYCVNDPERMTTPADVTSRTPLIEVYDLNAHSHHSKLDKDSDASAHMFYSLLPGTIKAAAVLDGRAYDFDHHSSVAGAKMRLGWVDTITLHNFGPNSGNKVKYGVHLDVAGSLSATGPVVYGSYNAMVNLQDGRYWPDTDTAVSWSVGERQSSDFFKPNYKYGSAHNYAEVEGYEGDEWYIFGQFELEGLVTGTGHVDISYEDTMRVSIVPLTEGASFTSALGGTYAFVDTVPEPTTWRLSISGLLAIVISGKLKRIRSAGSRQG